MINNFTWYIPTMVMFGKGLAQKIGDQIASVGAKKIMLIMGGQSAYKSGAYEQVSQSLKKNRIEFIEIVGVKSNPHVELVREAIARLAVTPVDVIVPVGGGSVFDTAKAVAAGAKYNGDIWDLVKGKSPITKTLPVMGVLTASATSSEMNNIAVLTNHKTEEKISFTSPLLYPKLSIIDPELQYTLPERQTVAGGIDIMAHVMERYFEGNEVPELLFEQYEVYLRSMLRCIPELRANPRNYDARAEYAWIATLSHNGSLSYGLKNRGDFSSHKLGHALSLFYDISHGDSISIMMPSWIEYVSKFNPVPLERFTKNIMGLDELRSTFRSWGAPITLREIKVRENDIERIADNVAKLAPMGTIKTLEREDIIEIIKIAW
ncbi:MAG: iron-containing alcohol dehydrogenase [Synergistaceae bacterium]|nr:iron-containing alcohol dehydrogenase [Synergistaceae bacterium]